MTVNPEMIPRWAAKAHRFAMKFAAETVRCEPPTWIEPTDEAFADCFARCVLPPPAEIYPLIREAFLAEYGPLAGAGADGCGSAVEVPVEIARVDDEAKKRERRMVAKLRPVEIVAVTLPGMEDGT